MTTNPLTIAEMTRSLRMNYGR